MRIIFIDQTSIVDWLTALGTLGAVVFSLGLALYTEIWKPKRQRAQFSISIDPLYSLSVDISEEMFHLTKNAEDYTYSTVKLRVEHIRGSSAKNVEILVSKIWQIEDGEKKPWENFYPSNLLWSGKVGSQNTKTDFAPSIFRFCDFVFYGQEWEVSDSWVVKFNTPNNNKGNPFNKFSEYLPAGTYEIELLITGENVEPTTSSWSLVVSGDWSPKEDEMFEKHCKIQRI